MTTFESLLERAKELKKQLADGMKDELAQRSKAIFEADANVTAVHWTQYAPYFNDGDPCTFSVNYPELTIEDEGDRQDHYSIKDEKLKSALDAFQGLIEDSDLSDIMETAFGDSVEVTITRDGEVSVEEYDHD
jgi:hypothetical protein